MTTDIEAQHRHLQALFGSLGRLVRAPLATILTLIVIGVAHPHELASERHHRAVRVWLGWMLVRAGWRLAGSGRRAQR